MNNKLYTRVMFDLDGTVIDSKQGIFNGLYYAFERYKITPPDETFMAQFIGPSIAASFINLMGFTPEKAEEATACYREYYSTKGIFECSLYDGIVGLCASLQARGVEVALATKKPEPYAVNILNNLNISRYFDSICGSDPTEIHDSKAHIIARAAGNNKDSALMVGDSRYDIIGSNEAGIDSVGVKYGFGAPNDFVDYPPTYIAETMDDLAALLYKVTAAK